MPPITDILPTPTTSRAMLSRDADSMYWMSRYVERAEHVARMLLVNSNLLMDVGDLAPQLQQRQWKSVLDVMRCGDTLPGGREPLAARIQQYMTFSLENTNSLLSCLTRARENARAIRESISAEMWECINSLYWSISGEDSAARFEESHDDFYRSIMSGSMLFQGLTDQTLAHDQRWLFTQAAKFFERVDVTSRIVESKFSILKSERLESPIRNIHWMAVLRSVCSIEAYRRHHTGDMEPLAIATFVTLQRDFPRSIRFGVEKVHEAVAAIRTGTSSRSVDPAERIMGRLAAQLEYAEAGELLAEGVPQYLEKIQIAVSDAAAAFHKTYFLH